MSIFYEEMHIEEIFKRNYVEYKPGDVITSVMHSCFFIFSRRLVDMLHTILEGISLWFLFSFQRKEKDVRKCLNKWLV